MDATLATGTVVDRYTVESVLGEGGMAIVYRVRHNQLGTVHALKVLTLASSQIRQRLLQEGRVQASLRHPNIVAVTDVVDLGGSPGLIMELIEGPSLDDFLARQRLTVEQADALARGILAGVAAAHDQSLVHRDLKPANILLAVTPEGLVPKVADFGLAKILSAEGGFSKTRTGATMGTPFYMSPEQVRDSKNVGPGTDVFALGAILYEMVTGQRAFEGNDLLEIFVAVASSRYVPVRERVPDLPERMERAIAAALQPDEDARPPSVRELLALWTGAQEAVSAAPAPSGPWDAAALSTARSMSPGSHPPFEPPTSDETWAGDLGTLADPDASAEAAPAPPAARAPSAPSAEVDSLKPRSSDSLSSSSTRLLVGLGGSAVLGLGALATVGALGLGVVAWLLIAGPEAGDGGLTEVAEAAVEEVAPAPADEGAADAEAPEVVPDEGGETRSEAPAPEPAAAPAPSPAPAPEPAPSPAGEPTEPDEQIAAPDDGEADAEAEAPPDDEGEAPSDPGSDEATEADVPADEAPAEAPADDPVAEADAGDPHDGSEGSGWAELGPQLSSSSVAVRLNGLNDLRTRDDARTTRQLEIVMKEDGNASVTRKARQIVRDRFDRRIGDHAAHEALVAWQVRELYGRERLDAIACYGRGARDLSPLVPLLQSSDSSVREAAVRAVEAVGGRSEQLEEARGLLEPLTGDPDRGVSEQARESVEALR